DASAWSRLAFCYERAGQWAAAADAHSRRIQLIGDDAECWYSLGRCKERAGDTEGARKAYYHYAVGLRAGEPCSWGDTAVATLQALGAHLASCGKLTESVQVFRRVTDLAPMDQSAWTSLGHVLTSAGIRREAALAFGKAEL